MPRFATLRVPYVLEDAAPPLSVFRVLVRAPVSVDGDVCPPLEGPSAGPPDAAAAVERWLEAIDAATPLGACARVLLTAQLRDMAMWALEHHNPEHGPLERFALPQLYRVRRKFIRQHRSFRLWREFRDERQRVLAVRDHGKRKAYIVWWRDRIAKLLRGPSWYVPGMSTEDVAGELLLALIRAIDSGDNAPFVAGGGPGVEGTFSFLVREKRRIRRRRQMHAVADRDAAVLGALHERTPSGEDLVIAREQRVEAHAVVERAAKPLTPKRRQYYDAAIDDAREHGYLNEVRVARRLGVHKSSVSRALKWILAGLRKAGATEFIDGKPGARRAFRRLWRADQPERPPGLCVVGTAGGATRWPQPPWLDEGDRVRIIATGEYGVVVGVDRYEIGTVYRVQCGTRPLVELGRDSLDYRSDDWGSVRF